MGLKAEQKQDILQRIFATHPLYLQVKHVFAQYPPDHQENLGKLLTQNNNQAINFLLQQAMVFKQFQDQQRQQMEFHLKILENTPQNTPTKMEDEFDDFKDAQHDADEEFEDFEGAPTQPQPISVSEQFRQQIVHRKEDYDEDIQNTEGEFKKKNYDAFPEISQPNNTQVTQTSQEQTQAQTSQRKQTTDDEFEFQVAEIIDAQNPQAITNPPENQLPPQEAFSNLIYYQQNKLQNMEDNDYEFYESEVNHKQSKTNPEQFNTVESNINVELIQIQKQQTKNYSDIEWDINIDDQQEKVGENLSTMIDGSQSHNIIEQIKQVEGQTEDNDENEFEYHQSDIQTDQQENIKQISEKEQQLYQQNQQYVNIQWPDIKTEPAFVPQNNSNLEQATSKINKIQLYNEFPNHQSDGITMQPVDIQQNYLNTQEVNLIEDGDDEFEYHQSEIQQNDQFKLENQFNDISNNQTDNQNNQEEIQIDKSQKINNEDMGEDEFEYQQSEIQQDVQLEQSTMKLSNCIQQQECNQVNLQNNLMELDDNQQKISQDNFTQFPQKNEFEQSSSTAKYIDIEWPEIEREQLNQMTDLLNNFETTPNKPEQSPQYDLTTLLKNANYETMPQFNKPNPAIFQQEDYQFKEEKVKEAKVIDQNPTSLLDDFDDGFEFQEAQVQEQFVKLQATKQMSEGNLTEAERTSNENEALDTIQEESEKEIFMNIQPFGRWREGVNKIIGLDIDYIDDMIVELEQLELGMYCELIREYKRLILDLNDLKQKKQIAIENEEFEVLVPIRDSIRMKEPIAQRLKQQMHSVTSIINQFKGRTLGELVYTMLGQRGENERAEIIRVGSAKSALKQLSFKSSKPSQQIAFFLKLNEELELVKQLIGELGGFDLRKEGKFKIFVQGVAKLLQMSFEDTSYIANDLNINEQMEIEWEQKLVEQAILPFIKEEQAQVCQCVLCGKFIVKEWIKLKGDDYHIPCINFYLNRVSSQI